MSREADGTTLALQLRIIDVDTQFEYGMWDVMQTNDGSNTTRFQLDVLLQFPAYKLPTTVFDTVDLNGTDIGASPDGTQVNTGIEIVSTGGQDTVTTDGDRVAHYSTKLVLEMSDALATFAIIPPATNARFAFYEAEQVAIAGELDARLLPLIVFAFGLPITAIVMIFAGFCWNRNHPITDSQLHQRHMWVIIFWVVARIIRSIVLTSAFGLPVHCLGACSRFFWVCIFFSQRRS